MIGDINVGKKPESIEELILNAIYILYREGITKEQMYLRFPDIKNAVRAKLRKPVDENIIQRQRLLGSLLRAHEKQILEKEFYFLNFKKVEELLRELIEVTYFCDPPQSQEGEEIAKINFQRRQTIIAKIRSLENELNELDHL